MKHNVFLLNIPQHCGFGGCECFLLDYFAQVDYTKHAITLVVSRDVFSDKLQELGVPVKLLVFPFKNQNGFRGQFKEMYSLLKKLKPNSVIFVHNGFMQFRIGCFLAGFLRTRGQVFSLEVLGAPMPSEKIRKKYFGIFPSMNLWWYKEMIPITLRGWLSRRILAVSTEVQRRLVQWYHYPKGKAVVEYHGADIARFHPDLQVKKQMRQKLGIPQSDLVIVAIARFDQQKRIDRLLEGFAQIYDGQKNVRVILVGNGPKRSELEGIVAKYNMGDRVKFMEYQDNAVPYLQMSDIYILSSDNEGFARVILESMAVGLVVVATDITGTDEVIEDNYNGILIEPNSAGIVSGLKRALDMSESQRATMGSNARKIILERFELKKQAVKELKVFDISGVTT